MVRMVMLIYWGGERERWGNSSTNLARVGSGRNIIMLTLLSDTHSIMMMMMMMMILIINLVLVVIIRRVWTRWNIPPQPLMMPKSIYSFSPPPYLLHLRNGEREEGESITWSRRRKQQLGKSAKVEEEQTQSSCVPVCGWLPQLMFDCCSTSTYNRENWFLHGTRLLTYLHPGQGSQGILFENASCSVGCFIYLQSPGYKMSLRMIGLYLGCIFTMLSTWVHGDCFPDLKMLQPGNIQFNIYTCN